MRLDQFLANAGLGSRSQVKEYLKQMRIKVDGVTTKDYGYKVNENNQVIECDGKTIEYKKYRYYMLNKPDGYITATEDKTDATVMDLLDIPNKKDFFPVGRLDKDTEGLLIITNDGEFLHNVLSPKKHVSKTYYARINGMIEYQHIGRFKEGIVLDDGYKCLPSKLEIVTSAEISEIKLIIYEGKFHQVKRMFEAMGMKVVYLKRVAMGKLELYGNLKLGEFRELSMEDIGKVKEIIIK
ncbi:MAG TPA: 16S rRNA pseudouridine(516) synthase [Clostridiales bacterium]|nr:MAG: 16S rRNA pseudouridine(516) synthase [Clostridiales bacterium GWD2_32_59]HAN09913.1 16S rRNA pseudouridine(516) synthase [Clostridiales bacterium]